MNHLLAALGASVFLLHAGSSAIAQSLDPSALLKPAVDSWPTYHGDYTGQRHSKLAHITTANVHQLTLAWAFQTNQPQQIKATPILVNGVVYFLKTNSGILSAHDAKTGSPYFQNQRLDGVPNVFASPVAAQGRVYFPGREGTTVVIKAGPAFEVLAKNTLDDGFDASPALVDNEMFLRGYKYLYAIAQQ